MFLIVLYALCYGVFGLDWGFFGSEVTAYQVHCCQSVPVSLRGKNLRGGYDDRDRLLVRLLREHPSASRDEIVAMAKAEEQKLTTFDLTQVTRRTFKVYPSEQKVVFWDDGGPVLPLTGCAIRDRNNWSCQPTLTTTLGFANGAYFNSTRASGTYYVSRFQWWQFKLGLYRSEPNGPSPLLSSTPMWGTAPARE
jgi:hypothetical protein